MAKRKSRPAQVEDYRHDATRKNNPPVGMVQYEVVRETPQEHYAYDPHLSPQLIWAAKPGLKQIEVEDEAGVDVDTVSLHIHERVSTQAIIHAVQRPEPKQLSLFADPDLPLTQAVQFYQHDVDWANRLILGDSLLVMNSLLRRELMGGKVQMIYLDPPYGVKFSSNFQPRIDRRDVKDGDEHLTREPEQIKAYRDTWTLGVHSYLTYLRDRLRLCRELLADSGSIFVQISDENVHRVRCLMDEVFGPENFVSQITYRTKNMTLGAKYLETIADFILWYAKDKEQLKYRQLYKEMNVEGDSHWNLMELADGRREKMSPEQVRNHSLLPSEVVDICQLGSLYPAGVNKSGLFAIEVFGKKYEPPPGKSWKTNETGLRRVVHANRVEPYQGGRTIRYVMKVGDSPVSTITSLWDDTPPPSGKRYVVETSDRVITRCILMSTDPGDLVFDPTCGSGTTAYAAEAWGRRWITCDTSRVALALARQRLLTATFPYYRLYDDESGVRGGFVYKTVPHITLKSIAQNTRLDPVIQEYKPKLEAALSALNEVLAAAGESPLHEGEVPPKAPEVWPKEIRKLRAEYWQLRREKQEKIDAIIAEDAPQETLYDQPEVQHSVVRVSGPFTVEAIPPANIELMEESPIGGEPLTSEILGTTEVPAAAHIPLLIDLLRQDGVTFPGNKRMNFASLTPRGGGLLHAEGIPANGESTIKRVAVSFGPQHGAVGVGQVEQGLREAYLGGFDAVVFCGFAFDAPAQAAIEANIHPHVKAFLAHIRPDVIMTDAAGGSLLKTTASSQLFTVFGEPDVTLNPKGDEFTVELHGVDVYDPLTGDVHSAHAGQIAAWFLDTDYDGRTFAICQAFFPERSAWKKLERALRGTLDKTRFNRLTGRVSLPFKAGQHGRVAVKVIDQRGNEVMRVLEL
jgi:adenine-specific DNA-methyltransferase